MRTTLTIDHDVSIALERVRDREGLSLKGAVNEALRRGLRVMDAERHTPLSQHYELPTWHGGGMLIDVTNVTEALEWAEGPGHK